MKILVVDDDEIMTKLLLLYLEDLKYEVVAVDNAVEAQRRLNSDRFDIMITDWMMPAVDGIELVRRVRANHLHDYLYIVMMTSRNGMEDLVHAIESGADDFLQKPIDRNELRVRLLAGQRIVDLENDLVKKNTKLAGLNEQMKLDLEAAREIQRSLLPKTVRAGGALGFEWKYLPFNELGGDLFNVFELSEELYAVYMIDVAGKGISAALHAVALSQLFVPTLQSWSLIRHTDSSPDGFHAVEPLEVVHELNTHFQFSDENQYYFTLFYGLINQKRKTFRYVTAGHQGCSITRSGEASRTITRNSYPIGFVKQPDYQEDVVSLRSGDRICLFSDGCFECKCPNGEELGLNSVLQMLDSQKDGSLRQSVDELHTAIQNACKPNKFEDDVSILALEVP